MQLIKSFFIACSLYSKIPVPQFAWNEDDLKYPLCFFPWIGGIIGICLYTWHCLCTSYHIGSLCHITIGAAIPIFLTGGFHIDGFLDTMDAFHSYQPKERKLEILKDSHIGAFAVIMFAAYTCTCLGAFSEIEDSRLLKILCAGFFLSRCLSGISAVTFPLAKKEGMLSLFASNAQKRIVRGTLCLQSAVCIGYMVWCFPPAGAAAATAAFLALAYYYRRCKKEFGGITGDTSGYFVLLCEGCILVAAAIINVFYV